MWCIIVKPFKIIPNEYIQSRPIIQVRDDITDEISFSKLFDIDEKIKDYGITLFLNQLETIKPHKITFPATEILISNEEIIYAYVMVDYGNSITDLIEAIRTNEPVIFTIMIMYITSSSRMIKSSDVVIKVNKDFISIKFSVCNLEDISKNINRPGEKYIIETIYETPYNHLDNGDINDASYNDGNRQTKQPKNK